MPRAWSRRWCRPARPDNLLILRKGATGEVDSAIELDRAAAVESLPGIAADDLGRPLLAKEVVVLITMDKRGGGSSNVTVRGIGRQSLALRPQVDIVRGRMPRFGVREMLVGQSLVRRFRGAGCRRQLCPARWQTGGWWVIMDAGSTAFNSEIWADAEQVMQAFRREAYSLVIFRLQEDAPSRTRSAAIVENDPRLTLQARIESNFYREQSEMMARFLRVLGITLTVIFSLGAVIGAMITMYSAVANRTAEIGTLRALGFRRRAILLSFLAESLFLGLAGGCAGLFFASFMQFITISTLNFQSFSELAFRFTLTPVILTQSLAFALVMGFIGGVLPAFRASRMQIVDALRTS
ncbi:MAG: ABC transporter permease [Desulfomonilia bacterium]